MANEDFLRNNSCLLDRDWLTSLDNFVDNLNSEGRRSIRLDYYGAARLLLLVQLWRVLKHFILTDLNVKVDRPV